MTMVSPAPPILADGDLATNALSFARHLRAANLDDVLHADGCARPPIR